MGGGVFARVWTSCLLRVGRRSNRATVPARRFRNERDACCHPYLCRLVETKMRHVVQLRRHLNCGAVFIRPRVIKLETAEAPDATLPHPTVNRAKNGRLFSCRLRQEPATESLLTGSWVRPHPLCHARDRVLIPFLAPPPHNDSRVMSHVQILCAARRHMNTRWGEQQGASSRRVKLNR